MEHNGDLCNFDHCFIYILYYFLSLYQSQAMQYHLLLPLYKRSSEAYAKCRRTWLVKKGHVFIMKNDGAQFDLCFLCHYTFITHLFKLALRKMLIDGNSDV